MGLRERTIAGVGWVAGGQVAKQVLQLVLSIILMRLLVPEDYGLIAMVLVLTGFASLFTDLGFSSALVRTANLSPGHTISVFWLNLVTGFLIATLFFLAAPLVARFYGVEVLAPITRWTSVTFILSSTGIVPAALLQREMAFDRIVKAELAGLLVSGVLGVALALLGWGVWSLVARHVSHSAVLSAALFVSVPWRPRVAFYRSAVRELWRYSANLTGFQFVNYWARQLDNLLIGKYLGSVSLGLYSRAYQLMLLPISQVTGVVNRVMFPALSRIQDDVAKTRAVYLRYMSVIAFVIAPAMFGLVVVAEPLVLALFGPKWLLVAPLIRVLAIAGLLQAFTNPTGLLYTAQGRTDLMFRWGLAASATIVVAICVGIVIGSAMAVAVAYLIANVALFYPTLAIPGRLIGLGVSTVGRAVFPTILVAAVMAGLTWLVGLALHAAFPRSVVLAVQVAFGACTYLVGAKLLKLQGLEELWVIARPYLGRPKAA